MQVNISEEAKLENWLADFVARNGRRLRVLHVGNIANNAYLNAKNLRLAGVEADVLCNDYYHIMGCPEWEDAEVPDHWGNDFGPNWKKAGIGEYPRPSWFFQGPLIACFFIMRGRTVRNGLWRFLMLRLGALVNWVGAGEYRSAGIFLIALLVYRAGRLLGLFAPRTDASGATLAGSSDGIAASSKSGSYLSFEKSLKQKFKNCFPARPGLTGDELKNYFFARVLFKGIFEYYDIVHCYGASAISGLVANNRPYAAFEHGTIRDIPFQNDSLGKLTALAYREANHVFITNCDAIRAAQELSLSKYSFVPHPVNEDHIEPDERVKVLRDSLEKEHNADFIIFHPARHHWTAERHPSWEKGNDLFVRGFAEFLKSTDPRAFAVFVEWGHTVAETKALLRKLGIADRIVWIKPQPNRAMVRYILASDVVADQFFLGAFGSLTPKALLCRRPVLLNLDEDIHRWALPEMPPVENVKSPEQITAALVHLYTDEAFRRARGDQCFDWYYKYHSARRIRSDLISTYSIMQDEYAAKRGMP